MSDREAVNLADKLAQFSEHWTPKIIAELNGQHVKLAKLHGTFEWHHHADADELFLVLEGELTMRLRDRDVTIRTGEMYIVPRGVEHLPVATNECSVLLLEPAGTVNTGDAASSARTVDEPEWI